jgi:hypothetical protein
MTSWQEKHDHIPGFPTHPHPHDHAVHFDMDGLAGKGRDTGWTVISGEGINTALIRPECPCVCHETVIRQEADTGCLTCGQNGCHDEAGFRKRLQSGAGSL